LHDKVDNQVFHSWDDRGEGQFYYSCGCD
jgi:hypothetical protein